MSQSCKNIVTQKPALISVFLDRAQCPECGDILSIHPGAFLVVNLLPILFVTLLGKQIYSEASLAKVISTLCVLFFYYILFYWVIARFFPLVHKNQVKRVSPLGIVGAVVFGLIVFTVVFSAIKYFGLSLIPQHAI